MVVLIYLFPIVIHYINTKSNSFIDNNQRSVMMYVDVCFYFLAVVGHDVECMDTCTPLPSVQRVLFPSSTCGHTLASADESIQSSGTLPAIVKTPDMLEGITQMDTTQDSVFEQSRNTEGSLSENVSHSPIHSVRTPVTENDPLGLFLAPGTSTQPTPAVGENTDESMENKCNLYKTVSIDSSEHHDGTIQTNENASADNKATSSSQDKPAMSKEDITTSVDRSWTRRGRNLMRGDGINKAWKFTTHVMSTKYAELKQNMTPTKSVLSSSNTSLPSDSNEDGKTLSTQRIRHTASLDDLDEVDITDGSTTGSKLTKYGGYSKNI